MNSLFRCAVLRGMNSTGFRLLFGTAAMLDSSPDSPPLDHVQSPASGSPASGHSPSAISHPPTSGHSPPTTPASLQSLAREYITTHWRDHLASFAQRFPDPPATREEGCELGFVLGLLLGLDVSGLSSRSVGDHIPGLSVPQQLSLSH